MKNRSVSRKEKKCHFLDKMVTGKKIGFITRFQHQRDLPREKVVLGFGCIGKKTLFITSYWNLDKREDKKIK